MKNDIELMKSIADMYNEAKFKNAEFYLGVPSTLIHKRQVEGIIDLNKLDYYNNLLEPYGLRMELHPNEEDYVLVFKSEYEFKPEELKI